MKIAALDLGSNTFLCLIAEVNNNGIHKIYSDHVEVVRLAEGLAKTNVFQQSALDRADKCLHKFSEIISLSKPDKILAMATAAARDAANKDELFRLCQKHHIPLEIISGDQEAQITYEGATSAASQAEKCLVIDIGGGSTEFVKGQGSHLLESLSAPMGCVKWTEKFFHNKPPLLTEIALAQNAVDEMVQKSISKVGLDFKKIIAVAGTPTALAAAHFDKFDPNLIDNYQLTTDELLKWKTQVSKSTVADIIKMGIPEGRADVILIGIMILESVLRTSKLNSISVSTRGVRFGIALEVYRR